MRDGAVRPSCNYFFLFFAHTVLQETNSRRPVDSISSDFFASQIKVIVFPFVLSYLPNVSVYISVRCVKVRSNWGGGRGVGVRKERGRVLR